MSKKLVMTVALAAPLFLTGCAGPFAWNTKQQDYGTIAVRFVTAPQPMEYASGETDGETQLVVDSAYSGFANVAYPSDTNARHGAMYHVALWGDQYAGHDVTYQAAPLTPGAYTFAVFDNPNATVMQGWLEVHNAGGHVSDFLYRWKEAIPRYKQQLAYDYELNGRTGDTQPEVFQGFTEQLRAFDELAFQIDAAIAEELATQTESQRRMSEFLRQSEVLLIPGSNELFRPTTKAAFSEEDLDSVRSGNPVTKLVLAADQDSAEWKMQRVNRMYNDLSRCRQVFKQEVDRLERKKGLMLLTDHLYQHDQRFTDNEMRLQHAMGCIERLDDDMNNLRERRVALAFIAELFTRDGNYEALDREASQLLGERSNLQPELRRLDLLFEEADEKSVKRVALQRSRQRVMTQMEAIDQRLSDLGKARTTLTAMAEYTQVIHRDGDMRLVTATLVGEGLPLRFRKVVERESIMSVRLEAGEGVFVPKNPDTSVTFAAPTGTAPMFANYQQYGETGNYNYGEDGHSHGETQGFGEVGESQGFGEFDEAQNTDPADDVAFEYVDENSVDEQDFYGHEHPYAQPQADVRFANQPEPMPGEDEECNETNKEKCCREMPLLLKIFVPPCWGVGGNK